MARRHVFGAVVFATVAHFAFKDWPLGIVTGHENQDGFVIITRSLWHTPTSFAAEARVQAWAEDRCTNRFGGQKLEANLVGPQGGLSIFGHVSVVCKLD